MKYFSRLGMFLAKISDFIFFIIRDVNVNVYLCFIDFEKEFDRIKHQKMLDIRYGQIEPGVNSIVFDQNCLRNFEKKNIYI